LESVKQRFPVIGLSRFYTKDGALLSFDCDYKDLGRQAGEIAMRIIEGAKPQEIHPVAPRKLSYSLNMAVAEKFGIKFTPDIVKGAGYLYGENGK
jgi:putative ABC transport system substrate-binding protein